MFKVTAVEKQKIHRGVGGGGGGGDICFLWKHCN